MESLEKNQQKNKQTTKHNKHTIKNKFEKKRKEL